MANLRLRLRCVRVARDESIATALSLGVSRASLHRWRVRYAAGGLEALVDRPRGPQRERLPAWVEQAVIVVRLLTYRNSKRLAAEFSRREIYPLDHHAVDGLLAEFGTARPSSRRERGPAYERGRPNELWHIDIKGPFFLRRSVREYEGLDSSASSMTIRASSSACASCPARRPSRSSPGSTTASSCAARRSS